MVTRLYLQRLQHAADLPLPAYRSPDAAGLTLVVDTFDYGDGASGYTCELRPGQRILAMTGVHVAIPEGHVGLICPLGDLALRFGLTVLGAPVVVDAGHRGELGVLLANLGARTFVAESGMGVAQLVLVPLSRVSVAEVPELPPRRAPQG